MYKKRFTKWGLQKNARRSTASTPTSTTTVSRTYSAPEDLVLMPVSPQFSSDDNSKLVFLNSVKVWSVSFFESVQSGEDNPVLKRPSWPEQSEEMNFTFKLVVDTFNRGYGGLAGRLVRKAFLLVEEMLVLEGPVVLWNVLEIMHYLVTLRQFRLCKLLFAHLTGLVDGRIPNTHPLPAMLRALRMYVVSLPDMMSAPDDSQLTPSPSIASSSEKEATTATRSLSDAFLSVIERAWTLNAEILFEHFDHRLFQLYLRIHWDSCSIEPPPAITDAAKKWLTNVTQTFNKTDEATPIDKVIQFTPFEEDMVFQRLFIRRVDALPPQNYHMLCTSSISMLRDHASCILSNGANGPGDTTALLRILACLVTAKIVGEWPGTTDLVDTDIDKTSKITRAQAGNIACAIRTSINLNAEYNRCEDPLDTIEQIRSILALREYGDVEIDPRLIQEMWLLKDALIAAGKHQEALEVQQESYQRLEKYIQDIPINST